MKDHRLSLLLKTFPSLEKRSSASIGDLDRFSVRPFIGYISHRLGDAQFCADCNHEREVASRPSTPLPTESLASEVTLCLVHRTQGSNLRDSVANNPRIWNFWTYFPDRLFYFVVRKMSKILFQIPDYSSCSSSLMIGS